MLVVVDVCACGVGGAGGQALRMELRASYMLGKHTVINPYPSTLVLKPPRVSSP